MANVAAQEWISWNLNPPTMHRSPSSQTNQRNLLANGYIIHLLLKTRCKSLTLPKFLWYMMQSLTCLLYVTSRTQPQPTLASDITGFGAEDFHQTEKLWWMAMR